MKRLRVFSLIGTLSMSMVLFYAFLTSSFFTDGGAILQNPWGVVSIVDLYVGFFLFTLWIFYREKSHLNALIWGIFMMVFGFLTASIYLLKLSFQEEDVAAVLLGKHQQ